MQNLDKRVINDLRLRYKIGIDTMTDTALYYHFRDTFTFSHIKFCLIFSDIVTEIKSEIKRIFEKF